MTTVLLTGSTGFVGRQLRKILQARGCQLRLVVREGSEARVGNMQGVDCLIFTPDLFSESSDWWAMACKDVDIFVHCAWYAEPGKYLQSEKNLNCLIGTLNIAKGAASAGVKRFVGVGTCLEYEMSSKPLSVNDPLKPLSPYAAAKTAAYLMLSEYFQKISISFIWCRLFYLYGDGEDQRRIVPYLHKQLSSGEFAQLTSGNQIRDFLDVVLAAEQIVDAVFSDIIGAFNICSGKAVSVREIAENIADMYNARKLLNFGGRKDDLVDPPFIVGVKGLVKL